MPTNREKMVELMQKLQDLYQQVENVSPDFSKLIVEEHIYGLEYELLTRLYHSVREYDDKTLMKRINHA